MAGSVTAQDSGASPISWQDWGKNVFEKAKAENRFVILDLQAVWCHWCHVMEETTYRDQKVVELIQSKYLPVRVDQDANPDLSNRYGDYGWPATIIFGPDGTEIVKRRGYVPPKVMISILEAIIKDPTPGPSVIAEEEMKPAESPFLGPDARKQLEDQHLSSYDTTNGGWGTIHKLIDSDNWEYAWVKAEAGDKKEEMMARQTLDQALNLLDPVWGGFYQYSDSENWKSPHFEKIMSIQSEYLRLYALAYAAWGNPEYLDAAIQTARYLKNFLTSPEGAFYVSQDADLNSKIDGHAFYPLPDAERRKLGMPRIDTHIYSRENGWAITGLTALYDAGGDPEWLAQAQKAAEWILAHRNISGTEGGFRHDEQDKRGPYLGDQVAMGEGFLSLYTSTGDRKWLKQARSTADFMDRSFKEEKGAGFVTSPSPSAGVGVFQKPVQRMDENIAVARFVNLLFHHTGDEKVHRMAEHAMRYLATPALLKNFFATGVLLVDREIASEPVHIAVIGHKDDPKAKALTAAALGYPANYKRIEWWDKREGPMPNPDVKYPELPTAAAFACAQKTCSLPVFDPAKVRAAVDRLRQKQKN